MSGCWARSGLTASLNASFTAEAAAAASDSTRYIGVARIFSGGALFLKKVDEIF